MGDRITARQFQQAGGTEDWRVLARGATALFRIDSLAVGAAFVERVGALADAANHHPDVDLRPDGVVVRTYSHDVRGLTDRDVMLARGVSAAAAEQGLPAEPTATQDVELTIDALDGAAVLPFWAAILGHEPKGDEDLLDPHARWPAIWFQQMDAPRPLRNRLHLAVYVPHDERQRRIDDALAAGGRMANEAFAPQSWTLADLEGNEADIVSYEGFDDPLPEGWLTPDEFREAVGVEDWRVVQGAGVHYPTSGFAQGSELVSTAARLADASGLRLFADLRYGGATLRVGPPEDGWIDGDRLDLARRVQTAARTLGCTADTAVVRDVEITIDAFDIPAVQAFWAAALGYAMRGDTDLFDPMMRGPSIYLQPIDESDTARREQRNRMHVDVFVPDDHAQARVDAALAAGGRVAYDAEAPEWWTIADPEGNEVDIAVSVGREEHWQARHETTPGDALS